MFFALAGLAVTAVSAEDVSDLNQAQAPAEVILARAGLIRIADLRCNKISTQFSCVVGKEKRDVAVSAVPATEEFRLFPTQSSGKREVLFLAPGANPDYDVYYRFNQTDFDAVMKSGASVLNGEYVENVERLEPWSAPAACTLIKPGAAGDFLTGEFNLASRALSTSRRPGFSAPIATSQSKATVDERCGRTREPLAKNLNYYVTPDRYWGQDILQLPLRAPAFLGPATFSANLHMCQYDGEWSSSQDVALSCTLTAR
jgi:hypothetical protein